VVWWWGCGVVVWWCGGVVVWWKGGGEMVWWKGVDVKNLEYTLKSFIFGSRGDAILGKTFDDGG
jgi:hypothetical protein